MRIYYHLSGYISHKKAGEAYKSCIRALPGHDYSLTDDPAEADLAILHDEPPVYAELLRRIPVLRRIPKVAYCVWETDILPEQYAQGLRLVDGVWTCSEFSRAALARQFPNTQVLPHVVARPRPDRAALAWAVERVGRVRGEQPHLFLSIVDTRNPRKNLKGLLAAFAAAFPCDAGNSCGPRKARLILKQYRHDLDLGAVPGVVCIPEYLTEERIAALHAVCDTYVSAHHAEAWGLPLSEAMSLGKRVIATGYSGNMQYMTAENSVPVPYTLVSVPPDMVEASPLFTTAMHWANIDGPCLAQAMRKAAARPPEPGFAERARASLQPFSREAVTLRLKELLDALPLASAAAGEKNGAIRNASAPA